MSRTGPVDVRIDAIADAAALKVRRLALVPKGLHDEVKSIIAAAIEKTRDTSPPQQPAERTPGGETSQSSLWPE